MLRSQVPTTHLETHAALPQISQPPSLVLLSPVQIDGDVLKFLGDRLREGIVGEKSRR